MKDEKRRLQIAYLTSEDPKGKLSWSGTTYYMAQALEKYCGDVHYFDPVVSFEKRVVGRIIDESSKFLLKKNATRDRYIFVAKKQAKIAARYLKGRSFDVIVSPIGETEIAYLETCIPLVLVKDATFSLLHDYYPQYSNLFKRSLREANIIENLAYKNAQIILYPSTWAARSAIESYHVEEKKVHVVPFGANFDDLPTGNISLTKRKSDRCRLLFVGRWWERKGGDIAFETLVKLDEMGIDCELIICGCTPPKAFTHDKLTVMPFLDKEDERQRKQLEYLYASSDFLFVPTRSECYGLVFCEASAFGLPVIATNTGGISEIVKDGENGVLLPLEARGETYAQVIAEIYRDDQRYAAMVRASRSAFEERLNWDAWGRTVSNILTKNIVGTGQV